LVEKRAEEGVQEGTIRPVKAGGAVEEGAGGGGGGRAGSSFFSSDGGGSGRAAAAVSSEVAALKTLKLRPVLLAGVHFSTFRRQVSVAGAGSCRGDGQRKGAVSWLTVRR
jgi:hypothetical protein